MAQLVVGLTRKLSVIGLNPITGSGCFLEQEKSTLIAL